MNLNWVEVADYKLTFVREATGVLMFYCGHDDPLLTLHPDGRVVGSDKLRPDEAGRAILDWIADNWPEYVRRPSTEREG